MNELSAQDVEAYQRDGVICVRGLLDPDEVERAREAIDAVLDVPGPLAQVASGQDDPGAFIEDFRRWGDVPAIEDLARHSRSAAVAATLMESPSVRFYHDHVLVKEVRPSSALRGTRISPTTTSTGGASARGSRSTPCPRQAASRWSPAPTSDPG